MSQDKAKRENPPAAAAPISFRERLSLLAQRWWRPAGTIVAVALALLLGWHVFYGPHGISVWQKERAQDRALQTEIDKLQKENGELARHNEQLKSDPDAIEREAREKLHYAKPGEVIYTLPAVQAAPQSPDGK